MARFLGDKLLPPKQVTTRIPWALHRRVKVKAAEKGRTMTAVIRKLLEEWVDEEL